jgi:hypothetical protein
VYAPPQADAGAAVAPARAAPPAAEPAADATAAAGAAGAAGGIVNDGGPSTVPPPHQLELQDEPAAFHARARLAATAAAGDATAGTAPAAQLPSSGTWMPPVAALAGMQSYARVSDGGAATDAATAAPASSKL